MISLRVFLRSIGLLTKRAFPLETSKLLKSRNHGLLISPHRGMLHASVRIQGVLLQERVGHIIRLETTMSGMLEATMSINKMKIEMQYWLFLKSILRDPSLAFILSQGPYRI
jgi:hypothetical protein